MGGLDPLDTLDEPDVTAKRGAQVGGSWARPREFTYRWIIVEGVGRIVIARRGDHLGAGNEEDGEFGRPGVDPDGHGRRQRGGRCLEWPAWVCGARYFRKLRSTVFSTGMAAFM